MKKITLICILMSIGNAFATIETGNSILEKISQSDTQKRQYLIGYVAGMYDSHEIIDIGIQKCLGENIRMTQLLDALEIYLKKNPQIRHYPVSLIFPDAIKSIFVCN